MSTIIRALTIWQPWADAIVHGPKRVENRTWRPRGVEPPFRLAIHAGKLGKSALPIVRSLWPGVGRIEACSYSAPLLSGYIIGLATVARVVPESECEADPWACGPWCWVLEDVVALEMPVPARGYPGLWYPPRIDEVMP